MKAFQIVVVFLLLLQAAGAHVAYSCKPLNWTTRIKMLVGRQVRLEKGKLPVDAERCTLTQNDRYEEICNIGDNTLMVSTSNLPSVMVTSNGSVHKMDCRSPEQRQQQQGQQQQQQQQQDQQETQAGEGPGHGGNTMGGGHGKNGNRAGHE